MSELDARVLGPVRVLHRGRSITLGGPAQRGVLAMLLLEAGHVVSRDRLSHGLWGDEPPATADATIQSHVSRLRRALGAAGAATMLRTQAPGYRVDLDDEQLDLRRFERAAARGRDAVAAGDAAGGARLLRSALAQWSGDPLADLDDAPFARTAVAHLVEARLSVLEDAFDAGLEAGDSVELVSELRQAVEEHPLRERLRAQLMLALYRGGRQADALDELRRFKVVLDEQLGLQPGPALTSLERDILSHTVAPVQPAGPRQTSSQSSGPPPLPASRSRRASGRPFDDVRAPVDEFVGRHAELATIEQRLRHADVRLVTLTGPGGVGKTRIAQQLARRWHEHDHMRVAVIRLDSLVDPDLVVPTIARGIGIESATSQQAIVDLIGDQDVLLVLDNVEHLLEAAPALGELLAQAPTLKLLVTSRISLRLRGEHEITVPPLDLPTTQAPQDVARSDAVRLFVERARARIASFAPDTRTMSAIIELVVLLDGLPLAIELAAARTKVLSPAAIVERLRASQDVIGDPSGHRADRQRTLRSTLEWSVRLLAGELERSFARLSVFVGPFDLDDAVVVVGEPDLDAMAAVEALADHSLLQRVTQDDGTLQFAMLRTVRSYAGELLDRDPDDAAATLARRDRHLADRLGEQASRLLRDLSDAPARWIRRHVDDLRAVLDSAARSGDEALVVEIAASLAFFWALVQAPDARRWIIRALDVVDAGDRDACARLHNGLARLSMFGGTYDEAGRHARRALDCVEKGARPENAVIAHNVLGQIASYAHDWDAADAHAATAMDLAETRVDGDLLAIMTRNYRADMQLTRGEWEDAAKVSRVVLSRLHDAEYGDVDHASFAQLNHALASYRLGDVEQARTRFADTARRARRLRSPTIVVVALLGHAAIADADGRHGTASELLAASDAHAARHHIGLGVPEQRLRADVLADLEPHVPAEHTDAMRDRWRASGVPARLIDQMEATIGVAVSE